MNGWIIAGVIGIWLHLFVTMSAIGRATKTAAALRAGALQWLAAQQDTQQQAPTSPTAP